MHEISEHWDDCPSSVYALLCVFTGGNYHEGYPKNMCGTGSNSEHLTGSLAIGSQE